VDEGVGVAAGIVSVGSGESVNGRAVSVSGSVGKGVNVAAFGGRDGVAVRVETFGTHNNSPT